jgi:hypothetical protein
MKMTLTPCEPLALSTNRQVTYADWLSKVSMAQKSLHAIALCVACQNSVINGTHDDARMSGCCALGFEVTRLADMGVSLARLRGLSSTVEQPLTGLA